MAARPRPGGRHRGPSAGPGTGTESGKPESQCQRPETQARSLGCARAGPARVAASVMVVRRPGPAPGRPARAEPARFSGLEIPAPNNTMICSALAGRPGGRAGEQPFRRRVRAVPSQVKSSGPSAGPSESETLRVSRRRRSRTSSGSRPAGRGHRDGPTCGRGFQASGWSGC